MGEPAKFDTEALEALAKLLERSNCGPDAERIRDAIAAHRALGELLHEFVTSDAIANYDSSVCWWCGEPKFASDEAYRKGEQSFERCEATCLLRRARLALGEREK